MGQNFTRNSFQAIFPPMPSKNGPTCKTRTIIRYFDFSLITPHAGLLARWRVLGCGETMRKKMTIKLTQNVLLWMQQVPKVTPGVTKSGVW